MRVNSSHLIVINNGRRRAGWGRARRRRTKRRRVQRFLRLKLERLGLHVKSLLGRNNPVFEVHLHFDIAEMSTVPNVQMSPETTPIAELLLQTRVSIHWRPSGGHFLTAATTWPTTEGTNGTQASRRVSGQRLCGSRVLLVRLEAERRSLIGSALSRAPPLRVLARECIVIWRLWPRQTHIILARGLAFKFKADKKHWWRERMNQMMIAASPERLAKSRGGFAHFLRLA